MDFRRIALPVLLVLSTGIAGIAGAADDAAAGRSDPLALVAVGKEAVARYTADPTVHAGAIVDAAVAYEMAQRATSEWTDPALLTEIQSGLFWCRKQMDTVAMQQYRSRVDALPRQATKATPRPGATVKPTRTPAASALATARPVDQAVLLSWVQRLQARVRSDIAARREPRFALASMKAQVILRDLADDGTMTLALDGGEISYPWRLATARDLAALAAGLPSGDDHAGHALAAFFLLAAGDEAAGRDCLLRAGAAAAEVERSFQATAAR